MRWNTLTNEMTINVTFSSLTTGTTASHIHCCVTPPGNAGVATTTPTFPGFPFGVTSGTYSRTFDMTDPASFNSAFVTANGGTTGAAAALLAGLRAGQAYLNIHTTMFPVGEIRGFLQEPWKQPACLESDRRFQDGTTTTPVPAPCGRHRNPVTRPGNAA